MYDLESPGHICLYGGTNTGKTFFMKYITDKYIKEKKYTLDDVYIFTTNSYQWDGYTHIYDEWNKLKDVKNRIIKTTKKGLILLDDFNNDVDTIHDKQYIDLFTRGRHMGIRVITVAHKPTSIGKDARESLLYAITAFSSNVEYISELSKYYFSNQSNLLIKLLKEGQQKGRFTMLVINKQTGKTFTDKAPEKEDQLIPVNEFNEDRNNFDNNQMEGGFAAQNISSSKNCVNDNSTNMTNYNINNQIAIKQRYEDNRVNNDLRRINYKAQKELELWKQKDECYDLCMKWNKDENEINRLVFLLNKLCSVSCVRFSNIEKWCKAFMNHNFPDVKYNDESTFKKIGNNYSLLTNLSKGEYVQPSTAMLDYITQYLPDQFL